jgi:phosphatidylinositol 3-kinase
LKPNLTDTNKLNKILAKSHISKISNEEKLLLWKYRHFISKNKDALTVFLSSVNWSYEKESKEALSLLNKWAPIDFADILHLLSSDYCANDLYNRNKNI